MPSAAGTMRWGIDGAPSAQRAVLEIERLNSYPRRRLLAFGRTLVVKTTKVIMGSMDVCQLTNRFLSGLTGDIALA